MHDYILHKYLSTYLTYLNAFTDYVGRTRGPYLLGRFSGIHGGHRGAPEGLLGAIFQLLTR